MKRMIQKTWMACITLMCVCFASCNDDAIVETSQPNETGQPFRLTASQETPSRLELGQDGMTMTWEPGDQLVLVEKSRRIVPIYMNAELTAPSTSATFVSETGVPAGEYWVIYNYNDDLVYTHHGFSSIDNINSEDKLVLWGELTVVQGNTSATIVLQHLYAKVRVELQNLPSDGDDAYQIGMYASKKGFPIYNQFTQSGIVNVDNIYDNNRNLVYKASNRKYHNIRFGAYRIPGEYNEGVYIPDLSQKTEIEKNSALILPADVSDGTVYFYVLKGKECYEISKSNIKFDPGKSYKVVLDMAAATKTTLTGADVTIPGSSYVGYFYQLTTPEDCRHAAYIGSGANEYMLMNDIDFQNSTYLPLTARYFYGNGKTMKNVIVNWNDEDYVGLIRFESEMMYGDSFFHPYYGSFLDPTRDLCTITDLTLENVQFEGYNYVGALSATNVKADNCKIKGASSIIGSGDYIGGFVGCNYFDNGNQFSISNSSIDGTCKVEGKNYVGGILGKCDNYFDTQITLHSPLRLLNSCSSAATVQATGDYVGGIFGNIGDGVGYGSYVDFASDGYNFSLFECINTGKVSGRNYVGGIGGSFALMCSSSIKDKVIVLNSASEGNVEGENYVGGIMGVNYASVNTCYSIGNITAKDNVVGGIVGDCYNYSFGETRIANCYSLADISVGQGGYAGGLIGYTHWGGAYGYGVFLSNSYFAGTNNAITGYGLIGLSEGGCQIKNCLTTLASTGDFGTRQANWDVNGDGVIDANDVVSDNESDSYANIKSIVNNLNVLNANGEEAYSTDIWLGYSYDCVKFLTGLSGSVVAPGFGSEIIY